MSKTTPIFQRYRSGSPILAERLNQPLTVIEGLTQSVRPTRENPGNAALISAPTTTDNALIDDDASTSQVDLATNPDGDISTSETWRFVSKTTRTERIEDDDNSDIYLDVVVTTSVTVQKPNGQQVIIQLEA